MIKFIYNTEGKVVGFACGKYIYQLNGRLIGQLSGASSHVHKVTGEYVGEFYKDMIVDLHTGNVTVIRGCKEVGNTDRQTSPGNRPTLNYGFPDVSAKLVEVPVQVKIAA